MDFDLIRKNFIEQEKKAAEQRVNQPPETTLSVGVREFFDNPRDEGDGPVQAEPLNTGDHPVPTKPLEVAGLTLSPNQARACRVKPGKTAIIATAGSGKTTTLAAKIKLLSESTPDHHILATTFTKAAAADLKSRIDSFCGRKTGVLTGTIHSFCVRLLFRYYRLAGFLERPVILAESERFRIIDNLLCELTGVDKTSELSSCSRQDVERWIAEGRIREFSSEPNDRDYRLKDKPWGGTASQVADLYEQKSLDYAFVDFDGIIVSALRILKLSSEQQIPVDLPRHVFVDEAQDLSALQWQLVSFLAERSESLDVIGDDDQSIYRFRNAMPWRFRQFVDSADHKYFLASNRRCARSVVGLAKAVIGGIDNSRRIKKDLAAQRKEDGEVLVSALRPKKGYSSCVELIASMKKQRIYRYRDFSFIARSTTDAFPRIESDLRLAGIPYRLLGGVKSQFDYPEMLLIKAVANIVSRAPKAAGARLLWESVLIGSGVSRKALDKIVGSLDPAASPVQLISLVRASKISEANKLLVIKLAESIIDLRKKSGRFLRLSDIIRSDSVEKVVKKIIHSEVTKKISRAEKKKPLNPIEKERRIGEAEGKRFANLRLIVDKFNQTPLAEALKALSSIDEIENNDADTSDVVTISTVHSSKGLEWRYVFICELDDDHWPAAMAFRGQADATEQVHRDIMDEERRLLYVAITRAKDVAHLTLFVDQHGPEAAAPRVCRFLPLRLQALVTDFIAKLFLPASKKSANNPDCSAGS